MGACAVNINSQQTSDTTTNEIDDMLDITEREQRYTKKLMLLGANASGKSTLLKQLDRIYNSDNNFYESTQIAQYTHIIRENIISSMLLLLRKSLELYNRDPVQYEICFIDGTIYEDIQYLIWVSSQFSMTKETAILLMFGYIKHFETNTNMLIPSEIFPMILLFYYAPFEQLDDEMAKLGMCLHILWNMEAVQDTFAARFNTFSFPDNMDYYFDKVKHIFCFTFTPNEEDIIKCSHPNTELVETVFEIKDWEFNIVCFNGNYARSVNKICKIFDDIDCCIYVAALDAFNKYNDDNNKNQMHESIELFDEIMNSSWCQKPEWILFLNKDDLFRESVRNGHSLSECFHIDNGWNGVQWDTNNTDLIDYKPQDDMRIDYELFEKCHETSVNFIADQYIKRNRNSMHMKVFVHVICAIDQDGSNIMKWFWDVQNMMIRCSLKRS
eukprot:466208_1